MDLVAPVYKIELKLFVPTILNTWLDFRSDENESNGQDGASVFFREEVVQRFVSRVRRNVHPVAETSEEMRLHLQHHIRTFSSIRSIRRKFGDTDGLLTFTFEMYAPLRPSNVGDPRDWVLQKVCVPLGHMLSAMMADPVDGPYEEWRRSVYKEMYRGMAELQHGGGFSKLNVGIR